MLTCINDRNHFSLPFIQDLYETSFPLPERRTWDKVVLLIDHSPMQLLAIHDDALLIGFAIIWQAGDWKYLEHFAIDPSLRGKHYGSRVIQLIIETCRRRLVLEVEPPTDEFSERRIRFYERNGFILAPFEYEQPPYRIGDPAIPMCLMSMPAISQSVDMEIAAKAILHTVYAPFWT